MRTLIAAALVVPLATPAWALSCAERVGFVKTVIDKDLKVGFIGAEVHAAMAKDLEAAKAACAGGQDAKAQLLISSTQSRHGYPVR
jgi:hypothetical protein